MVISKQSIKYISYWTIIFIVSISMIVYGLGKPIQFRDFDQNLNSDLSDGHKLMWKFYSYSLTYPIIIGIFEVFGGVFLLINRTRIFGYIILTIILSNIIIQDYIYEIRALNSAIYYQSLIFILMVFDYNKVKAFMIELFKPNPRKKNVLLLIVSLLFALLLKYFETRII